MNITILNELLNFSILVTLFVVSFSGSMISVVSIEMAESDKLIRAEQALIKLDSSRINPVLIKMSVGVAEIDVECLNQAIADQRIKQEKIRYFFRLVPFLKDFFKLPEKIILLISSTFMGLLGSLIMMIKEATYDGLPLYQAVILRRAALGFSSGLLVIVMSYVLPSLLTLDADIQLHTETIIALSLMAGLYFKRFITRLSTKIK